MNRPTKAGKLTIWAVTLILTMSVLILTWEVQPAIINTWFDRYPVHNISDSYPGSHLQPGQPGRIWLGETQVIEGRLTKNEGATQAAGIKAAYYLIDRDNAWINAYATEKINCLPSDEQRYYRVAGAYNLYEKGGYDLYIVWIIGGCQ